MRAVYLAVTLLLAVALSFSAFLKLTGDPQVIKIIHETIGVPMAYLPVLAACEIAGALGLVAGIVKPPLGIAAAVGLVIYFVGAVMSHLRVGDVGGIGGAVFMLVLSMGALALRMKTTGPSRRPIPL